MAAARNSRRIEDTKVRAVEARRTSGEQVRNVIEIYDEQISSAGTLNEEDAESLAFSVTAKSSSASVRSKSSSTSGSSKRSKGVPPRLLQKIGQQRKRDRENKSAKSSLASKQLSAAKLEHATVRKEMAGLSLVENLMEENTVLVKSEVQVMGEAQRISEKIEDLTAGVMRRLR